MRMETAITSSPIQSVSPIIYSNHVGFFPFCFGQKHTPIAQCNACYLMGERGEATNGTTWASCSLLGNQQCLGTIPQSL